MKVFVRCTTGLEKFVVTELEKITKLENVQVFDGIVVFECNENMDILLQIKIVDEFLIFVKKLAGISRYRTTLKNIRQQVKKSNFRKLDKNIKTLSVKTSYSGRRDYTAGEVNETVAEGIVKKYGWKLVENNADIKINVILKPDISLVGLNLTRESKYKTVPGSLKRSVANVMIKLANLKKKDVVLDPMCGSGIIPIEASLIGAKAIGGDIDKKRVELAKENNKIMKTKVEFKLWDALDSKLSDNSIDKIVCNLPFGKQVKIKDQTIFFDKFINEMLRISKKGFTWAFLTTSGDIIKKTIEKHNLKLKKVIKIINSGLESEILVINRQ